jgi:hypothetical protein
MHRDSKAGTDAQMDDNGLNKHQLGIEGCYNVCLSVFDSVVDHSIEELLIQQISGSHLTRS